MSSTLPKLVKGITTAELLAMPEDGIERELIRGFLKEREMTRCNRIHAATESRIVYALKSSRQLPSSNSNASRGRLMD